MVVGEVAERADVVVVGGGPGGYAAALRCADLGKRVILVEKDAIGGTCLNVGCIPSKVLIHAADLAHSPVGARASGVSLTATVDAAKMLQHRHDVVRQLTSGVRTLLGAAGVEVWSGTASFSRPDRLAVSPISGSVNDPTRHLEFDHCILATGSRPLELTNLPLDGGRLVDSTGALQFSDVPKTLAVVGGGYIGIELGTAWAKLGSEVSIIEMADRILPGMDKRLATEVSKRLKKLGVSVLTSATATGLNGSGLMVETNSEAKVVAADKIIVAVGRRPNTDSLGLNVPGIELLSSGHIPVAPDRRATAAIFAIGDITPGPALAHKATAEAEVAASAIGGRRSAFDPAAIPEIVFSDPEIASVGLHPASAKDAGVTHRVFRFPYAAGSRPRTLGDTAGFVQLLSDDQGTLLGAQIAGVGASELIGEMAMALEMAATVEDLAATIRPHPTMSEAITEAAHGLMGHPLHVRS